MNLKKLFKNGITLISSKDKICNYAKYCATKIFKGYGTAKIPFGGFIHTSSFSEYLSVYGLMPDSREIELVRQRIGRDSVVFDIGANVGTWTVLMNKICQDSQIHSFEPNPTTFSILEKNIIANGCANIKLMNFAASNSESEITFQVPSGISIYGRVLEDSARGRGDDRFSQSEVFKVKSTRLADYCDSENIDRIDFMKIDVEGHELSVLKGLEPLLRQQRIKAIYIETMEQNHKRMGASYMEFLEFFGKCGYGIHTLMEDGTPGKMVAPASVRHDNHLCLPLEFADIL